jgi:hypothetical protein
MPDIPNRSQLESELARRFSKLSAKHRKRLMELMGDPPNMGNVPSSYWEEMAGELNGSFIPFLTEIYMDAAERLVEDLPISVDWGLVNERAASWARGYSYELVHGITTTSRRATQEAIASFFEQGQTRADLEARLSRIFGAVRAEAIAVTEVTRAASLGEQQIAAEIASMGVDMVPVWQTNNDELVCTICGPRHNQEIEDNFFPPAHPRCRCWLTYELLKADHG